VAESLRDPRLVIELPVIRRDAFRRRLAAALRKSIFSRDPGKTEATPSNARGNRLDAKRVTTEGIDAKALLESVHREWRDLVDEIGAEKLRDGYRASLGLYPLNSGH
jgi:hypothetical protein